MTLRNRHAKRTNLGPTLIRPRRRREDRPDHVVGNARNSRENFPASALFLLDAFGLDRSTMLACAESEAYWDRRAG